MGKVSIIVPVYNCEAYIGKSIESLMMQTYKDIEILLMVGFCKDYSLNECLEMQKKDGRIVVVSRKDSSLGDARNYALKIASGEYIAYMDADDFYSEDYIEQMVLPLEQDKMIDISCCGYDRFEGDKFLRGHVPGIAGVAEVDFQSYIDYVGAAAVWMKLFRRKWLLDNHIVMFDGCCEDQSLHFVLAALIKKVYFIQQPLYHYNIGNENSLVRTLRSRLDYADAAEYAIKYLQERGLFEKNRSYFRKIVSAVFRNFLHETYYDEELVLSCRRFLLTYFPETVEEYETARTRDFHIKKKVVMYGAGADAENFLGANGSEGISYIVDRNQMLHGQYKYGLPIRPIQELYREKEEVSVIVATSKYYYEVVAEFRKNNLKSIFAPREYCNSRRIESMRKTGKPLILLFGVPVHANIGDHMIAEAEKKFFRNYFPDYCCIEITNDVYNECGGLIHNLINQNDVLVITGGGFLGSLWIDGGENIVRRLMEEYKDCKIVVFPQSLFFEETKEGKIEQEISRRIYNGCEHLTLFFREAISYQRALSIMNQPSSCSLVPDIVLSMTKEDFMTDERRVYNKKASGDKGAICLKDCKESKYGTKEKEELIAAIRECCSDICFTSMYADGEIAPKERKRFISDKLEELSGYRFVVTDALHCMLSCALIGTPCVALDNISGKVGGVYEWIRHLPYIQFIDCCDGVALADALRKVQQVKDRDFTFDYGSFARELGTAVRGQAVK